MGRQSRPAERDAAEKSPVTVLVGLATTDTLDLSYGGACKPSPKAFCDDHFWAARLVPAAFWSPLRIPFSQLHQLGFGVEARWDPSRVVEIHIAVKRDVLPAEERAAPIRFDLWIDDITLY